MKLILVLGLIFGCGTAWGQDVSVDPIGTVDLAKVFSNVRAGYVFGTDKLAVAYVPLLSLRGRSGVEYINLDAGYGYNDGRKGSPIVALGFRADSLAKKIGSWKPILTTAILPPLETGPTVMIDFSESRPLKNLKYMWLIALRLGADK